MLFLHPTAPTKGPNRRPEIFGSIQVIKGRKRESLCNSASPTEAEDTTGGTGDSTMDPLAPETTMTEAAGQEGT